MARLLVFYHFLYPDQVVSSVHFSELAAGLAAKGWDVTGYASNRDSSEIETEYSPEDVWAGVIFRRFFRPNWRHFDAKGRILNASWMVFRWSSLAFRFWNVPNAIVVGTDPILSVLVAIPWKLMHPRTQVVHWCFDLYPEAAFADGMLSRKGKLATALYKLLKRAYKSCDLIVDIGSCMRRLLERYESGTRMTTLVPWALSEPAIALEDPKDERRAIFGDARLALMYSGTFGRAHSYEDFLEMMRYLRGKPVHLALSVKGSRASALEQAVELEENRSISFVPFAPFSELETRLASADIHLISLREEWTGTVVPSKFFGALAAGRPVLFCGSEESCIAGWIKEFGIGWVLAPGDARRVAEELAALLEDPTRLQAMRQRCFAIYQRHFSREHVINCWHEELQGLLPARS